MANWSDPRPRSAAFNTVSDARTAEHDAGLRRYMLSVYNYMLSGVLLTAIVAMGFQASGLVQYLVAVNGRGLSLLGWVVMLAPLGIVFAMSFGQRRMAQGTLQLLFWAYAALMGASLSTIFLAYTGGSIAIAFFSTAAAFAGLSLFGYTTKRDLSAMGTFLIMGVVGLLVAMVLNAFLHSPGLNYVISFAGVLIFAGLTAYDTQKTKSLYAYVGGTAEEGRVVIMAALNLYLDFINMFLFLLRIFGSSRN